MTDAIQLERERGLLTLRLNRPDKKNALTRAMYSHLAEALKQADTDPEINAVLITGTSECFTAGNDIADFLQHQSDPAACARACQSGAIVAAR